MFQLIIFSLLLLQFSSSFKQSGFKLLHDHIELDSYDKNYIHNITLLNQKCTRTKKCFGAIFTATQTFDDPDLLGTLQAYMYLSNKYVILPPLRFQVRLCMAIKGSGIIGFGELLKDSNMTQCPIKPNTYYIKDFIPDQSELPPNVPPGKYRVQMSWTFRNIPVIVFSWYGEVQKISKLYH